MLKFAWQHKEDLNSIYVKTLHDPKYKYLDINGYLSFDLELAKTTWERLEYVSIDVDGNVLGYFCASLDLKVNSVSSLYVMNFYDKSLCFSKDFHAFLSSIVRQFTKVSFSMVVGNPVEPMYDRIIHKYNGRIVGIKEDHCNIEGQLYDLKMYEILRRNYMTSLCPPVSAKVNT